jgi:DNA-directed RNA polymerase specialized sigma24 family protein
MRSGGRFWFLSDDELVSRTKGGDTEAFGALHARHFDRLEARAKKEYRGLDATDLASETLSRALKNLDRYTTNNFCAWLNRILENLAKDKLRREPVGKVESASQLLSSSGDPLDIEDTGKYAVGPVELDNGDSLLQWAVGTLPDELRVAIAIEYESEDPAALLELLGISKKEHEARLRKANARMREILRRERHPAKPMLRFRSPQGAKPPEFAPSDVLEPAALLEALEEPGSKCARIIRWCMPDGWRSNWPDTVSIAKFINEFTALGANHPLCIYDESDPEWTTLNVPSWLTDHLDPKRWGEGPFQTALNRSLFAARFDGPVAGRDWIKRNKDRLGDYFDVNA